MEISKEILLNYIKTNLSKSNPDIDLSTLCYETDLSSIGVESIVIISLLSQIEDEFKINISIDSLEKNNFIISVGSITGSILNERP